MSHLHTQFFRFCSLSLCLIPLWAFAESGDSSSKEDSLDWDALLEDTEEILAWSEDPLAELGLEEDTIRFWSVSLRAGPGESTNFLKRNDSIRSYFLKTEADAFWNALYENASLTLLLYGEYTAYEDVAEADSEAIVIFQANYLRFFHSLSAGVEFGGFYGDQIYDASLSQTSEPMGTNLRQFRPKMAVFLEKDFGRKDLVRFTTAVTRALFGDAEDDYWQPEVVLDWTHAWTPGVESTTSLSGYTEFYDEDVPRGPTGLPLPGDEDQLEVRGIELTQSLSWEPALAEDLRFSLRAGAARESEERGQYKSLERYSVSLNATYRWFDFKWSASARWQNTRYDERHSGILQTRKLHYTYRSLALGISRELPWNLSAEANVQWNELNSRNESDSFSERRLEILVGWTY